FTGPASEFIKLDPQGKFSWIEAHCCPALGITAGCEDRFGLYNLSTRTKVGGPGSAADPVLANRRFGRRSIASTGRALVFRGPQLEWLDASGEHPIRNVNGAFEAVTDASGANVAYVEDQLGKLHWISGTDFGQGVDETLGVEG